MDIILHPDIARDFNRRFPIAKQVDAFTNYTITGTGDKVNPFFFLVVSLYHQKY